MNGATGRAGGHTEGWIRGRATIHGLVLLLTLLFPVVAFGASVTVRVSADIKPWLKFSAVPRVGFYQVDAAALRQGYVDIPASLNVELTTNLRDEVTLGLVSGGPETVQVLDGGASSPGILRFAAVGSNAPVTRQFDLRVLLPPGLDEGLYPLHLEVSAAAL